MSEAARKRLDAATFLMDRYRIPKLAIGAALAEFYRCPFLTMMSAWSSIGIC